jgi:hypothetical protein
MSITTIWHVLNNNIPNLSIKRGIEIPMIQRDYAQGRKNDKAREIRKVFLSNLLSGIERVLKEGHHPLELDFIYGYIESEMFIPLDGQQRLTTLYLLHWYLAFKEQVLENFKSPFSKFNYQTRQSSEDFLKCINRGLSNHDYHEIFKANRSFESVLTDKNWYFVNWKYDLTIQSAITMLDDIHVFFNSTDIKFDDLINEEKPCIVFNFLDIRNFGLSDDLYIKMNSRGKPLTNFENLKAELGKFIEQSDFNGKYSYKLKHSEGFKDVNVETYFVTKIDTDWTNYFWEYRDKETNEFDGMLLYLLAFVSLNEIAEQDYTHFDSKLKELDKTNTELSYYKFHSLELLSERSIISYIEVLDLLVSKDELIISYFNDKTFLDKWAISDYAFEENFRARYEQRVLFYAVFKFLIVNKNILQLDELKRWDRLINNLVANTIYNTPKDFQDSIVALSHLLNDYTGDIYGTFINIDLVGFDTQQIKEERLKIMLMEKSKAWTTLILEAESHGYLKGQIMFLLAFSGIYDRYLDVGLDDLSEDYYTSATLYFLKFKKLFKETGLRHFENELFRRALLAKGNYLMYSTNFSLFIDSHRDISWKRLLKETGNQSKNHYTQKCEFLKMLFDEIDDNNVESSLMNMIKSHNTNGWQKDLIENPMLMKLSFEKYIKFFENGNVYILRKSKYNKYADPELKSLLLKKLIEKKGFAENDIELGFIENLNQYGIVRIKHLKPKVVYNHNGTKNYLLRQKGREDFETASASKMVKYITENFS